MINPNLEISILIYKSLKYICALAYKRTIKFTFFINILTKIFYKYINTQIFRGIFRDKLTSLTKSVSSTTVDVDSLTAYLIKCGYFISISHNPERNKMLKFSLKGINDKPAAESIVSSSLRQELE